VFPNELGAVHDLSDPSVNVDHMFDPAGLVAVDPHADEAR
jgi:hypothetical protein